MKFRNEDRHEWRGGGWEGSFCLCEDRHLGDDKLADEFELCGNDGGPEEGKAELWKAVRSPRWISAALFQTTSVLGRCVTFDPQPVEQKPGSSGGMAENGSSSEQTSWVASFFLSLCSSIRRMAGTVR